MKYSSLNDIQKNLTADILSKATQSDILRQIVAQTESKNVDKYVYQAYKAQEYDNRGLSGGLADPDNVELVSAGSNGVSVKLIYENTTEGVDTLQGEDLADTIIEGKAENFANPNGKWANKRDFITPTIEELKQGNDLRSGLIDLLRQSGYQVK